MASTTVTPNSTTTFSIKAVHNDKSPLYKGPLLSHSGSSCRSSVLVSSARTSELYLKKPNSIQSRNFCNDCKNNHDNQHQDHLIPQIITGADSVPLVHNHFDTNSTVTATPAEIEEMGEDNSFFRSMTFNLRFDTPNDGPNVWNNRKYLVASTVHFHRPDVMGVQEAKHNQMEDLDRSLPEYGWVGVGRDDGAQAGEYCAIFYRKRKFDYVDSGTFWLSETPDSKGSKSWGSACIRICSWIRLKFKSGNNELFVFNAHFDHHSSRARAEAAALLSRHIPVIVQRSSKWLASSGSVSIIVMGDFNDFPSSPPYNALVNANPALPEGAELPEVLLFKDSRTTAKYKHNADAGSFTDWIRPEQHTKPQILIDYILYYGNLEPETYGIICELFGDKQASDHRPVVSDFYLKRFDALQKVGVVVLACRCLA